MEYPVYLQMTETENVVAVQGPTRFWEGQMLGDRVLQHDVVCQTWPERQRVMDMLEPDGPWSKISKEAFDRVWSPGGKPPQLDVEEHVELAAWTTFGISSKARWFARVATLTQLREALAWAKERDVPLLVLGGGSNMLLHGDVHALVLQVDIRGVEVSPWGDKRHRLGWGRRAHGFVMQTLDEGWHGLENLSLIPATSGPAPCKTSARGRRSRTISPGWTPSDRRRRLERLTPKCHLGTGKRIQAGGTWQVDHRPCGVSPRPESPLRMGYGAIEHELASIPVNVARTEM